MFNYILLYNSFQNSVAKQNIQTIKNFIKIIIKEIKLLIEF